MNEKTLQVLNACTIHGNNVKLPEEQLDRKEYEQVKKALEDIGGKWKGGKIAAFVFDYDPTDRMTQLQGGEKVNLKKEYQFFATPAGLADKLVEIAEINDPCEILEPSAGRGAIIEAIHRKFPTLTVDCFELMYENLNYLLNDFSIDHDIRILLTGHNKESDFTKIVELISTDFIAKYDRIIANPPFTKNQDIQHVMMMYNLLKSKGRLVSIMSEHFIFADDAQSKQFRHFLTTVKSDVYDIPAGTFKESGTMVKSRIVVINKA